MRLRTPRDQRREAGEINKCLGRTAVGDLCMDPTTRSLLAMGREVFFVEGTTHFYTV